MNTGDLLPRIHAFVLESNLKTSASAFATMAPDLQAQLREDLAPLWGVGNGDVVMSTALVAGEGAPVGVVPINVHAKTPASAADSGALAEHGDEADGTPEIDVFEDLLAQVGIGPETPTLADALSMAISHELIEARCDSDCQREATLPDGRVVAVEACDQIQAQPYNKGATVVSNFNTPSNFGIDGDAAPFDFLGKQTAQFQCEAGGYEQVLDPDTGWQMITAELIGSPTAIAERPGGSFLGFTREALRAAIDAIPNGMLRYRLELAWRGLGRHSKRRRRHTHRGSA
jgi:hypothetical protein